MPAGPQQSEQITAKQPLPSQTPEKSKSMQTWATCKQSGGSNAGEMGSSLPEEAKYSEEDFWLGCTYTGQEDRMALCCPGNGLNIN